MAQLTFVLGGIRSGKSRRAEELAAAHPPVVYLATALAGDEEMCRRIQQHRQRRPQDWQTVECPWDLPVAITQHGNNGCLLVECIPLWVTNLVLGIPGHLPLADAEVLAGVDQLIERARQVPARSILVSNEVGWGLIPADPLARRFGDLLGTVNQQLAAAAAEVHLCIAGLTLRLK